MSSAIPPGNFEMLSRLNELELCGLLLIKWQPDLDYYSGKKKSLHKSNLLRHESISKFSKFLWVFREAGGGHSEAASGHHLIKNYFFF